MMRNIEVNPTMEFDRFLVGQPHPHQVVKPQASIISCSFGTPSVEKSRNVEPVKPQVLVLMFVGEPLNDASVVRMCHNPDLVVTRKVPRPVPREAWLRALSRTASMPNDQNPHVRRLL